MNRWALAALTAGSVGVAAAPAALVQYRWGVTINQLGPYAPPPGLEGVRDGDKAFVSFTLDTSKQSIYQSPFDGGYPDGATNIRYEVPRLGYVFTAPTAFLSTTDATFSGGLDIIRVECAGPVPNSNFLIWLRTFNTSVLTSAAVPTSIDIPAFDYTQYVGFFGFSSGPGNIVGGVPQALSCPADLNSDTFVDDSDFVLFARAYNILDCGDPLMPAGCPADFNTDSYVDDADFVTFAGAYNELVCP